MALKRPLKAKTEEGPNDHLGEEPIDAPVGHAPRVVQVPMNQNADVNPKVHAAKLEEKKQRASSAQIEKGDVNVKLILKAVGARGGKIAYFDKKGKAVYESAMKKKAPEMSKMAHNWTGHSERAENSLAESKRGGEVNPARVRSYTTQAASAHATAAKQHMAAAFYSHHAGDSVSAKEHYNNAVHHRDEAKKHVDKAKHYDSPNEKSAITDAKRSLKWVDKNHDDTHELVHYGRHEDPHTESVAADADEEARAHEKAGDKAKADESRAKAKTIRRQRGDVNKGLKAITPSNSIGGNMSKKNEVADLFKSELGESNASNHVTNCVHCTKPLSRDDLKKGLGPSFVADDNEDTHSGGPGQVEPSRVAGGKENDEIAPLLKGLKGPEAGGDEEYPISKSEMLTMGMKAEGLDDGWYTITKSEMQKRAPEHLAFLVDRKNNVAKSLTPKVKRTETIAKGVNSTRSTTDGPHGYSPRAGGVHGPAGESLVQWSEGSDADVAKFIEQSGGYGPGTDESIRTEGRGY